MIDSTGIKAEGEGEWNARKHGGPKRRIWRKVHIAVDEETLEIRAVEGEQANAMGSSEPAHGSHIGDAPMLPELLDQIPPDEDIGSVTGDGAFDTRKCHDVIADRGAEAFGHSLEPMAFMPSLPPRKNAKPWKPTTAGARAGNEIFRAVKYLGPAIWRRWSGYHRQSRVEAKMHCVKRPGQSLMARDFDRQVAEIQIRCAVMNRYTALGTPMTTAVG